MIESDRTELIIVFMMIQNLVQENVIHVTQSDTAFNDYCMLFFPHITINELKTLTREILQKHVDITHKWFELGKTKL